MTQLLLSQLRTTGLMRHDRTIRFGAVNYLVGFNGSGKSEVIEALRLLSVGRPGVVGAHVDDIMRLARVDPDGFTVDAQFLRGAEALTLRRSWSRDPDTAVVSAKISGSIVRKGARVTEARGFLSQTLGGWSESWTPLDLRAGGAALRRKLIELLGGGAGLRVEDYLPPEAPEYLRPLPGDEDLIDLWAAGAIARAKFRASKARELLEAAEARCAALEGAGSAPDTSAITERLAGLRDELAQHDAADAADGRVSAAGRAVEEARARRARITPGDVGTLSAELEALVARRATDAGLEAARASAVRLAAQVRAAAVQSQRALVRVPGAESWAAAGLESRAEARRRAALGVEDCGRELDRLHAAEATATETWTTLRDAHRATEDALAAIQVAGSHFATCPSCAFDLRGALAEQTRALDAAELSARGRAQDAREALEFVQLRIRAAEGASAEYAQMTAALDAAEKHLDADRQAVEAEALVPALPVDLVTDAMIAAKRAALETARRAAELDAEIARLELDHELAAAELAAKRSTLGRARVEVQADIERSEAALEEAGAARARVEDLAEAKAEVRSMTLRLASDRAWVTRMEAAEGQILGAIATAIERPCSEIMAAEVRVALVDARGNPDCRITRDGVDLATLSDGERALAGVAILRALGPTCGAPWRPVLLDRFEAVDRRSRPRAFHALLAAVEAGEIDQAFVAGCPDIVEAPEAVNVIRLSEEES